MLVILWSGHEIYGFLRFHFSETEEINHQCTAKYPRIATVVLVSEPALGGSVNLTPNSRYALEQFVEVVPQEVTFSLCISSGFVIC